MHVKQSRHFAVCMLESVSQVKQGRQEWYMWNFAFLITWCNTPFMNPFPLLSRETVLPKTMPLRRCEDAVMAVDMVI